MTRWTISGNTPLKGFSPFMGYGRGEEAKVYYKSVFVQSVSKRLDKQDKQQLRKTVNECRPCSHTVSAAWAAISFHCLVVSRLCGLSGSSIPHWLQVTYMTHCMDSVRPALKDASTVRHCGDTELFASPCIVTFLYEVTSYQRWVAYRGERRSLDFPSFSHG